MSNWGIFFLLVFSFSQHVFGETIFPNKLNQRDRQELLSILGFGTAPKIISNPYPLGGYDGWELGFSSEFLSLEEVPKLGSSSGKVVSKGEFNFYNLSITKGIFENIDTTISFMPSLQGEGVSGYGVSFRWMFYEAQNIPLALTTNLYGGGVNIQSLLGTNTLGIDVLCTMAMEDLALYFGAGQAKVTGVFTGGSAGLTDDFVRHTEGLSSGHSLFGLAFQASKALVAFQVDRYNEPVYGARIGWRY